MRIHRKASIHSFVIQGTDTLSLVYLPMFNVANHRRQVIVTVTLPSDTLQKYIEAKQQKKDVVFTIHTKSAALTDLKTLEQIFMDKKFTGDVYEGLPDIYGSVGLDHIVCISVLIYVFRHIDPLPSSRMSR